MKKNGRIGSSGARWIAAVVLLTLFGFAAAAVNHRGTSATVANPQQPTAKTDLDLGKSRSASGPHAQFVADRAPGDGSTRSVNPFDGQRAYGYLQQICAIGPRVSGSPGMMQQLRLLRQHFAQLGGHVSFQQFLVPNPLGGRKVQMINTIVQWHPEKQERILLCAHYDTRPLPDRDPNPIQQREGKFIGANDGASGVAVLMELANLMPSLDIRYGVDFVLFDGEELVYVERRDRYFLGSEWFARQYVKQPPPYKYRWGVLLDMVGDTDLQIYQEGHSVSWDDTRPLVAAIWGTAQRLGVSEFVARAKYQVQDDHLALRHVAKIPTCDIIDFDYPAWHTASDLPDHCSPTSLAKVGWVVYEWLRGQGAEVGDRGSAKPANGSSVLRQL